MYPHPLPEEYYVMLYDLQAIDFVLVELTLYLDTHPDDTAAFHQYEECSRKRAYLAAEFEQKFGPLKHFGQSPFGDPAKWAPTPWPWQV
ncbi:spore coat protein CotJB [Paenibacillus larvae]|uniref:spore coat protein CotJB n=1 Tax=Paenibacillus larvae TaxID=1464 RepID=UPI00227FE379|nr:spore coat protein CotJB [Paenibacillus larvae]MCY9509389.1 spore coat protein CotJB [Paenibacillus larvae]MCY9527332.1 spore coat protein CotJB [Paenibacillus larvae]